MTNINWNEKPEWATGAGYSTSHNLWLWFDDSHYQMSFGDVRFPFNSSFSKDGMTDIQLACDNQLQRIDVDWSKKPEWADVWIEDKGCPEYSGWHKETGNCFVDFLDRYYNKPNMSEDKVISYPPTKGRNAEGLPLIGEECQSKPYWHKVTIIAHHDSEEGTRIVFWDHHDLVYGYSHRPDDFRTFKTDKEKWVDQAMSLKHIDQSVILCPRPALVTIYDAMESGKLPTIKVTKNETN